MTIRAVLGLLLLTAACSASPPGSDTENPDAGSTALMPPVVDPPPTTPLETTPLRGRASEGVVRVVAQGDNASYVGVVDPGDLRFCIDAPLDEGSSTFKVIAVSDDGRISPASSVTASRDPGIAEPEGARCREVRECDASETCGNGTDDDCNGFTDACDAGCNGCADDIYEPNDTPFDVPMLVRGTFDDLSLCPCSDDFYALDVAAGTAVTITATFVHTQVDLDLRLFTAAGAEDGAPPLKSSTSVTNTETITHTFTSAGVYYLQVYTLGDSDQGAYTLRVQ